MRTRNAGLYATAVASTLAMIAACGGGGSSGPTPVATPTPQPAATITATGEGQLVVHPSLDTRFAIALETPIRITETAGGTADWNYARVSSSLGGVEVERYELGSDIIRAAGFSRIGPRSSELYNVLFRFNSEDIDRVDITLGFGDIRDGRLFEVAVPDDSFSGFDISIIPLSVPPKGAVRLGKK